MTSPPFKKLYTILVRLRKLSLACLSHSAHGVCMMSGRSTPRALAACSSDSAKAWIILIGALRRLHEKVIQQNEFPEWRRLNFINCNRWIICSSDVSFTWKGGVIVGDTIVPVSWKVPSLISMPPLTFQSADLVHPFNPFDQSAWYNTFGIGDGNAIEELYYIYLIYKYYT